MTSGPVLRFFYQAAEKAAERAVEAERLVKQMEDMLIKAKSEIADLTDALIKKAIEDAFIKTEADKASIAEKIKD